MAQRAWIRFRSTEGLDTGVMYGGPRSRNRTHNPVAGSRQNTYSRRRLFQAHLDLMEPRVWFFRREAQCVAAVQVVVKINQAILEGFVSCEQFVLAPGHRGDCFGDV